jgi:hypothetical protein
MSYYIDYINLIINHNETKVRNPPNVLDLKNIYSKLKIRKYNNITINSIEICSNSMGCTPKKQNGHHNFLVKMKNKKVNITTKKANDESNYILLNISGTYNFDGIEQNIHFRVPRSGTIKVVLGLRNQRYITLDKTNIADREKKLMKDITDETIEIIDGLKKTKPSKIVSISIKGLNVFNPKTGELPEHKIFNFLFMLRKIDELLPDHEYDFNFRNGKKITRGHFKSEKRGVPTIGITQWGMTDFMGGSSISQTHKLVKQFINAFNLVKQYVKFDKLSTRPKKQITGSCRVGQNVAVDGKCSDGKYPYPKKDGTICCKTVKMTPRLKKELIQKYVDLNLKLPNSLNINTKKSSMKLPNSLNINTKMSSMKLPIVDKSVTFNMKTKKWYYKSKPLDCMKLRKPDAQSLAQSLQLNPKGFMKDICKIVDDHLYKKQLEKRTSLRKKFRLLKMKQSIKSYT